MRRANDRRLRTARKLRGRDSIAFDSGGCGAKDLTNNLSSALQRKRDGLGSQIRYLKITGQREAFEQLQNRFVRRRFGVNQEPVGSMNHADCRQQAALDIWKHCQHPRIHRERLHIIRD